MEDAMQTNQPIGFRAKLCRTAARFLKSEDGPSATEYAILLAMLVLGAMATIGGIGSRMQNIYVAINDAAAAAGM